MSFLIGNDNIAGICLGSNRIERLLLGKDLIYGPEVDIPVTPEPYLPNEYFYFKAYDKVAEISFSEITKVYTTGGTTTPTIDKTQFVNYTTPIFEYSYDKLTWSTYALDTIITLNKTTNPIVYFRGNNDNPWYDSYKTTYSETVGDSTSSYTHYHYIWLQANTNNGQVKSGGNILSLRDASLSNITTISCDYAFSCLFNECTNLLTAPVLSATTLRKSCYGLADIETDTLDYDAYGMFNKCTSLSIPPELPAISLAESCYQSMFKECISLIMPPALPATTLATKCYQGMFNECTSLNTSPELPATTLTSYCYASMFKNCTSLITPPNLLATVLADHCYGSTHGLLGGDNSSGGMFENCILLQTAPALPATTLAESCYDSMFAGCSSLAIPPALPATELVSSCYEGMFARSGITETPKLAATTVISGCYGSWIGIDVGMFEKCQNLTRITTLPALTIGDTNAYYGMFRQSNVKASATQTTECQYAYRVPTSGTGTADSKSLTAMFTNASDSSTNFTPTVNTTFYINVPSF